MTRLRASEARDNFSDTLNRVAYGGECIVLERNGKDVAAVIPPEDLRLFLRLLEEFEDREDVKAAREAMREPGTVPWEEVKESLGL